MGEEKKELTSLFRDPARHGHNSETPCFAAEARPCFAAEARPCFAAEARPEDKHVVKRGDGTVEESVLEKVRREIREVEAKLARWREVEGYLLNGSPIEPREAQSSEQKVVNRRRPYGASSIQVAFAQRVLQEAGTPLKTKQIVRKMLETGLLPGGVDAPTSKMTTFLHCTLYGKTETFKKVGPGLWDLVSREAATIAQEEVALPIEEEK